MHVLMREYSVDIFAKNDFDPPCHNKGIGASNLK